MMKILCRKRFSRFNRKLTTGGDNHNSTEWKTVIDKVPNRVEQNPCGPLPVARNQANDFLRFLDSRCASDRRSRCFAHTGTPVLLSVKNFSSFTVKPFETARLLAVIAAW